MKRWQRWGLRVVYWLAVLAVSLVLLVVLIQLIESRDKSSLGGGGGAASPASTTPGAASGPLPGRERFRPLRPLRDLAREHH
jgi:hypothetical protein